MIFLTLYGAHFYKIEVVLDNGSADKRNPDQSGFVEIFDFPFIRF